MADRETPGLSRSLLTLHEHGCACHSSQQQWIMLRDERSDPQPVRAKATISVLPFDGRRQRPTD